MKQIKTVAVLMGGTSSERPVSLNTGAACAEALAKAGYEVHQVDVGKDIARVLTDLMPDVAFNGLHGPVGEDGVIQGLLELLEIPYTHSGVMSSALAMNKEKAKIVAQVAGLPVAQHLVLPTSEISAGHPMAPPYVIKPVAEGSSFGVTIVQEGDAAPVEIAESRSAFGEIMMVERFVPGRELTCAVLGERVLGITEIFPEGSSFYDYKAKYAAGGSRHVCPAELDPALAERIGALSLDAHRALNCRGATRSDFRYDPDRDELIWLEVNTQPGMTRTSLLPELAEHAGIPFEALVTYLIEDASLNR
ncbi:D-alanine--D-alanine ligase [Limimaricola cinnabarinus]|uniref:D-alanine--D-alanine ligase n=1 Tax=Limimaricola cinnabarinus TaxID=1125964 RepID=UPI0024917F5A|nr:D-alanine--D-alanine ligase [Limimaricola cinnabarinus]